MVLKSLSVGLLKLNLLHSMNLWADREQTTISERNYKHAILMLKCHRKSVKSLGHFMGLYGCGRLNAKISEV